MSTHGTTTFVIKPSKSGTFSEAQKMCKADGLELFEPRDEATYLSVIKFAQADPIWLNVKRAAPENP